MNAEQIQRATAYATARANETGKAYLITGMGHVWVADARNRIAATLCSPEGISLYCGIHSIVNPEPKA
jgi:poly(3-hydroxybutyrate) depolymerase